MDGPLVASDQLEAEIVAIAKDHDGRYLLRTGRPPRFVSEEDQLRWRVCEHLVITGRARWLRKPVGPGIELI